MIGLGVTGAHPARIDITMSDFINGKKGNPLFTVWELR